MQAVQFLPKPAGANPSVPDDPVLRRAPEGVGPHGSRRDAFDAVSVVWEHVNGLLHRHVVHMHLGVGGSCD